MELTRKAQLFATQAHERAGQTRKFTGEPYIVHPASVVQILMSVAPSAEMIAAAWLHDVVEDTDISPQVIEAEFGPLVAQYVEMLTDVRTRRTGGERIARKNANLLHSARACPEAQTIKLCDLIDNAALVVERDPLFARKYLLEMKRLLRVLTAGHPQLYQQASALCESGLAALRKQPEAARWLEERWARYEADLSLSSVTVGSASE
ncbi:HD domain-containing protein [Klebsiella pneumoniae]|jgi:(p)ppGpp synthase/HD superfamily hydrolase|uniref:HD domain-containing protein n=1 Tax=Enterobacteriaceae TaxID=543 RepID=UPI003523215A